MLLPGAAAAKGLIKDTPAALRFACDPSHTSGRSLGNGMAFKGVVLRLIVPPGASMVPSMMVDWVPANATLAPASAEITAPAPKVTEPVTPGYAWEKFPLLLRQPRYWPALNENPGPFAPRET